MRGAGCGVLCVYQCLSGSHVFHTEYFLSCLSRDKYCSSTLKRALGLARSERAAGAGCWSRRGLCLGAMLCCPSLLGAVQNLSVTAVRRRCGQVLFTCLCLFRSASTTGSHLERLLFCSPHHPTFLRVDPRWSWGARAPPPPPQSGSTPMELGSLPIPPPPRSGPPLFRVAGDPGPRGAHAREGLHPPALGGAPHGGGGVVLPPALPAPVCFSSSKGSFYSV